MGSNFSTTTSQNPSDLNPSQSTSKMPSISPNSQNPDPKSLENQNPDLKLTDDQNPEISNQPINPDEKGHTQNPEQKLETDPENEEEEEGECGFCLFMKGGGCKDEFIAWENCVEEAEKNKEDIVDKCFEVTGNLKKCMEAHSDYYNPILQAEKAADEEVKKELDREAKEKLEKPVDGTEIVEGTVEFEVEKNRV